MSEWVLKKHELESESSIVKDKKFSLRLRFIALLGLVNWKSSKASEDGELKWKWEVSSLENFEI